MPNEKVGDVRTKVLSYKAYKEMVPKNQTYRQNYAPSNTIFL